MRRSLAAMTLICAIAGSASAGPHDVFATFMTQEGNSYIQISDCGDGTPCGEVVWINPTSLQPGFTVETVVGLNGEPILGALLLKDFKRKGKDWRGGIVYDPENDKEYSARIKRLEDGNLQLKGCVGPFCQTQVWTHVPNQVAAR